MTRILVVEDDLVLRRAIARTLSRLYTVATATDGHDALGFIRAGQRFDLIISDLEMPKLDGSQLYWQLVEIAPSKAGRMLFMSGRLDRPTDRLRALDTPILVKPFEPARLLALVAWSLDRWVAYTS